MADYMKTHNEKISVNFQPPSSALSESERKRKTTPWSSEHQCWNGKDVPVACSGRWVTFVQCGLGRTTFSVVGLPIPGKEKVSDTITVGCPFHGQCPISVTGDDDGFVLVGASIPDIFMWNGADNFLCVPFPRPVIRLAATRDGVMILDSDGRMSFYDYKQSITDIPWPEPVMAMTSSHGHILCIDRMMNVVVWGTSPTLGPLFSYQIHNPFSEAEHDYTGRDYVLNCNEDASVIAVANPFSIFITRTTRGESESSIASAEPAAAAAVPKHNTEAYRTLSFPAIRIKSISMSKTSMYYIAQEKIYAYNFETHERKELFECTRGLFTSAFVVPERKEPAVTCVSANFTGTLSRVVVEGSDEEGEEEECREETNAMGRKIAKARRTTSSRVYSGATTTSLHAQETTATESLTSSLSSSMCAEGQESLPTPSFPSAEMQTEELLPPPPPQIATNEAVGETETVTGGADMEE